MEKHDEKVIGMESRKTREEGLKRKYELIKGIVIDSALSQLEDVRTYQVAAAIGLYQGLKYRGNLKQGINAGVASVAVFTACTVVVNLVKDIDEIKKA